MAQDSVFGNNLIDFYFSPKVLGRWGDLKNPGIVEALLPIELMFEGISKQLNGTLPYCSRMVLGYVALEAGIHHGRAGLGVGALETGRLGDRKTGLVLARLWLVLE